MAPAFTEDLRHVDTGEQLAAEASSDPDTPEDRLRRAVDLRLARMREGLPCAQHSHSHLMDLYGSVVDLDLGWRSIEETLCLPRGRGQGLAGAGTQGVPGVMLA
ncbi:MAG: hypothetical protein ACOC5K_00855 [Chloroflexota bacterium]